MVPTFGIKSDCLYFHHPINTFLVFWKNCFCFCRIEPVSRKDHIRRMGVIRVVLRQGARCNSAWKKAKLLFLNWGLELLFMDKSTKLISTATAHKKPWQSILKHVKCCCWHQIYPICEQYRLYFFIEISIGIAVCYT